MTPPDEPPSWAYQGRCYWTNEGRVRRVIEIRPEGVRYSYRSFPADPRRVWRSGGVSMDIFTATVEREVPCDWTLEADR